MALIAEVALTIEVGSTFSIGIILYAMREINNGTKSSKKI
jgi:hypothetical protein